jgi:hypothetical protein
MHVSPSSRFLLVVAAFALAGGSPIVANAADPAWEGKPSAKIDIDLSSADTDHPTPTRTEGRFMLLHFDHVLKETGGKTHRIGVLKADYGIDITTTDGEKLAAGLRLDYRFEAGDSMPMLDQMYQAVPTNHFAAELKRVTDDDLVKNLPKDRSLIVLPVGSSLELQIGVHPPDSSIIDVAKIAGGDAPASPRRVRVAVNNVTRAGLHARSDPNTYDAAVGDVLPLVMECQLTVKKIVPPDEKHKILGWVEFSPNPPKKDEKADKK